MSRITKIGIPSGGTTSQVLVKNSNTDYDVTWGAGGGGGGTITGSGTTNEITYWTGASAIGSLSTATYPSLTELSYVKGVTSAIQTQLNGKSPLASPTFTGTPLAPTASVNTNTTQIATTEFVITQIANEASISNVGAKLYLFNSY